MINQPIIPAINKIKSFEVFLKTDLTYGFVMDIHINHLVNMVKQAHSLKKKIIVHIDMIKGVSNDDEGCEFLCQTLKVDGIISTKPKLVEIAKKNKKISILRLFMIDTKSLNKGLELINSYNFDYLEVLPATSFSSIPYAIKHCPVPLIGGGLIQSDEDIKQCLDLGMQAISTSNTDLWKYTVNRN